MLLKQRYGPLWEQWQRRHKPAIVKALSASAENAYFDENPDSVDQDTYNDFIHDRHEMLTKYGESLWQIDNLGWANREALWITRLLRTARVVKFLGGRDGGSGGAGAHEPEEPPPGFTETEDIPF